MASSIASATRMSTNSKKNKEKGEVEERVDLYVKRVQDPDPVMQKRGLEHIKQEIRSANPKTLKFLRCHYETLQDHYENMAADSDSKKHLADVLSALSLSPACLKYRLLGSDGDIGYWGHEYVMKLACEIPREYGKRESKEAPVDDLMDLVENIVAFLLKHNAESEAVDLLVSIGVLDVLEKYVVKENYNKTCLYLIHMAMYGPDMLILDTVHSIYLKFEDYYRALWIALHLNNMQYAKKVIMSCKDLRERQQLFFTMARHGKFELDNEIVEDDEEREKLQDIINNAKLSEGFHTLARDLEVMEPKSHDDIFKADLTDGRGTVDSARQNLAATFVNAFVNAGFCRDKLMTVPSDASSDGGSTTSWLFKNKEHGKISAAASLGMISLWDLDSGLAQLDKCLHSTDTRVITGALLGVGIVNCNVQNECDPALTILADYVDKEDSSIRIGAIMGLGLAYAGTQNEQVRSKLMSLLGDGKASLDVISFAAISLGLVYVGSCNEEVAQAIIFALMDRSEQELDNPLARFMTLGLGLLYLGKQESVEPTAEVSKAYNEKIKKYCDMTLLSCAYAGTGDVLKVQHFLDQCAQSLEKGGSYQGPAVLGIAMVTMAEEVGLEMGIRSLEHLLQYGEQNIRRAVPYALALLCISNPKFNVIDTLSRLSHDEDTEVAIAAIVSMGLTGAGTNNARIKGMLQKLSSYYYKDADLLFCVRIALGLLHMGKGLMTLSPYHSERFLLSQTALAGIVIMLHACLDMKAIILDKYHYVLYFLVLAMHPRMLMTVDEDLKPLSVPVRVGQAVDVAGQPGWTKTITGFQTHSTPVLLSAGDRAELATEKYIPLSPILEGFVVLKQNPANLNQT